jgi:RecA-family ATPase
LANDDAILALPADGRGNGALVATPLYQEIDGLLAENRPALLVLDTLADIYGGNEIVRAQVRQFINMLRRLALNYDSTVVVLARIRALAGMETGTSDPPAGTIRFDRGSISIEHSLRMGPSPIPMRGCFTSAS